MDASALLLLAILTIFTALIALNMGFFRKNQLPVEGKVRPFRITPTTFGIPCPNFVPD